MVLALGFVNKLVPNAVSERTGRQNGLNRSSRSTLLPMREKELPTASAEIERRDKGRVSDVEAARRLRLAAFVTPQEFEHVRERLDLLLTMTLRIQEMLDRQADTMERQFASARLIEMVHWAKLAMLTKTRP